MAIDGFFLKNLKNEINLEIQDYRLDQINFVTSDILSFSFYLRGIRKFLNFKLNAPYASLFIADLEIDKTINSSFLQTIKKQLLGSTLKTIEQLNDDRVLILEFQKNDFLDGFVTYQLILEIMGRYNNLILLKDNIIIDAFNKNVSHTSRSIVPGILYNHFPTTKIPFTLDAYKDLKDSQTLSTLYIGISPLLSKYLYKNNINLNNLNVNPTLNLINNQFYWFNLFEEENVETFSTLSKLINHLITNAFKPNNKYLDFVNKRLSNLEKRLFKLNEQLSQSKNDLSLVDIGNSIYSSGHNLNSYLNEIVTFDFKIIKLDITKTLNENAQLYFKKYKKAKNALSHLEKQILETTTLINLFKQFTYDITNHKLDHQEITTMLAPFGFGKVKKTPKINKAFKPLKLFYNDNIYYIGLNNLQNEEITTKIAKSSDYWFHVKDLPGSHVVLKGEFNETTLKLGAMLALKHSFGFNNSGLVNYTQVKNLKRIKGLPGYQVNLVNYQTVNTKVDEKLLANKLKKSSKSDKIVIDK